MNSDLDDPPLLAEHGADLIRPEVITPALPVSATYAACPAVVRILEVPGGGERGANVVGYPTPAQCTWLFLRMLRRSTPVGDRCRLFEFSRYGG